LERKIVETFAQAIMSKSKYFGQGGKKDIYRKDIDRLEEFLKDKKFLELTIRIFLQGLDSYSRIKSSKNSIL
jgi:hypothetical protein